MKSDWIKAKKFLLKDGLVVLPTDTLYGLVASVDSKKAIEKIYEIKERDKSKALIVLISSLKDLEKFGIKVGKEEAKILGKFWPGEVSVLLSCKSLKWKYIHRGTKEIAFRMIGEKNKELFNLLKKVGPVVAPSANLESFAPAETIKEARSYFGSKVDLYINSGRRKGDPSTLIRIKNSKIEILRQGKVKIK
ncbi:MAG: L-threonylcarbamoyladenylate synthase [Candidatus Nomurabacteria bacterium]|nr:L-threonylcarbamoyladenylate synthase [Candidatus Nomurabacteria bacterium]